MLNFIFCCLLVAKIPLYEYDKNIGLGLLFRYSAKFVFDHKL